MTNQEEQATARKIRIRARVKLFFGWVISLFCAMALLGASTTMTSDDIPALIFVLIFLACGILLIVQGCKLKKLVKTYYDYSARLANDPHGSIDALAATTNTSVSVVLQNLSQMIKRGFFVGAYIDTTHNKLVMPHTAGTATVGKATTVQCKGCGAPNAVTPGIENKCEYCGLPL